MKKIYMYLKEEVLKNDFVLIPNYEDYEIERINGIRTPFNEWLESYTEVTSDEVFLIVSRPYTLGYSLDDFLKNGLSCIDKGLKVIFKCRHNLSFIKLIDYTVFTTKQQQKAAFSSVYSIVMTDVYAHKNGRKRDTKSVKLLRNYWLAYIYKNSKSFKGCLNARDIFQFLHISSKTMQELRYEVQRMLDNGKQEELENMVMNELYKDSSHGSVIKDNKILESFKEKLAKALSSSSTQLELFSSDDTNNTEAID